MRLRKERRKREVRGGQGVLEVDEGRAGEVAGGWWADSTGCTAAAVAARGSHHSSAIFPTSPPIYLAVFVPVASHQLERVNNKKRGGENGERDLLGFVKEK